MGLDATSFINLDLKAPNAEKVYANQYDSAGTVKAQLLNNGEKWEVPSGAYAVVSFRKSDNIGGYYDTTDYDEIAVSVDSDRSIIYVTLDPQTLTTYGIVFMQVNFLKGDKRLSTFAFLLEVKKSAIVQTNIESKWFVKLLSISGIAVDDTLSILGRAADAKITGDAINDLHNENSEMQDALQDEVRRAVAIEASKLNKPINNPDGTAGQLLRTNGDGSTSWTDQGLPTDAQTGLAVSNWLDAHPEATTTVENDSLVIDKFVPTLREKIKSKLSAPDRFSNQVYKEILLENLGTEINANNYAHQGCTYNSDLNHFILSFSGENDENQVIVEVDSSWNYIREKKYTELGHANDITYNPKTKLYYIATLKEENGIAVVEPTTLEIQRTITIPDVGYINQIVYVEDENCYYFNGRNIETGDNIYKASSDFSSVTLLIESIDLKANINENYETNYTTPQGCSYYNGRYIDFYWDTVYKKSCARLCFTNESKSDVDFNYSFSLYNNLIEPESLTVVGDKIYMTAGTPSSIFVYCIYLKDEYNTIPDYKGLLKITDDANDTKLNEYHNNAFDGTAYEIALAPAADHLMFKGYNGYIRGFRSGKDWGWQEYISPALQAIRFKYNGSWTEWSEILKFNTRGRQLFSGDYWDTYWWDGSYTPSYDGLAILLVKFWQGDTDCHFSVIDVTKNMVVASLVEPTGSGSSISTVFPYIKGHEYKTNNSNKVADVRVLNASLF